MNNIVSSSNHSFNWEEEKNISSEKDDLTKSKELKTENQTVTNSKIETILAPKIHKAEKNIVEKKYRKKQVKRVKQEFKNAKIEKIDPKFVCDESTFLKLFPYFQKQIIKCKGFDSSAFLTGENLIPSNILQLNQQILNDSIDFLRNQAKQIVINTSISVEDAYKLLIGFLDQYDDVSSLQQKNQLDKSHSIQSTFALRSALLLSSIKDGVGLQSWMVYTKSGKPDIGQMWDFLDIWKNWVPEAQGAMAKFLETTFIQAKELARKNPKNQLILLKGGFGAGKTRLAGDLFKENINGVVAPDLAKRVVRRSMEKVPHALAHIQGSQIAYKLFDEIIQKQIGTVVYDSSLSLAKDVSDYLKKSKKAGKKVVIYDIGRHDMARSLAVLKRNVKGNDPRIPPNFIIRSAINDKLNRVECMKVILNETNKEKLNESLSPEYHFLGANKKGWDTQKVLLITPYNMQQMAQEMKERLALEEIEINLDKCSLELTTDKNKLEKYFNQQFERSVQDILSELSVEESQIFYEVFSKRVLISQTNQHSPIYNTKTFYEALPKKIKNSLSYEALDQAFQAINPTTREQFFKSIQSKRMESISYLNLPLKTALTIHHHLQEDPWL